MWQHTCKHTTDASPEQLWATITDIEGWSSWDPEIEFTRLNGPLALGSSFTLKPKGGPKVKLTVEEFSQPVRFADPSHLPLGKMRTVHEFHQSPIGTQITVIIQIYGVIGFLWRKLVGEKQAAGLPEQTAHFVAKAKTR
jgi:hypothetical protein